MRFWQPFKRKRRPDRDQAAMKCAVGEAMPPAAWQRTGFYTVEYFPDGGYRPFAIATLQSDGAWTLEFPGNDALSDEAANLRAAMSKAEEQWTEHSRSLRTVDSAIEEANRPL